MTVITETKLKFTKLSSRIGAEIRGLDLSADLSPDTVAQLRDALNTHKALVFRQANIRTDEDQVRFASRFGPLTKAHPTVASVDGKPAALPVDSENGSANNWHTDVTFVVNPPQASTLRSITLPGYGGETLIASSAGAYRDLPEELRNFADTLWAIHTNDYDYSVPQEPRTHQRRRTPQGVHQDPLRIRPPRGAGPPADRRAWIVHWGLRAAAADCWPVQHRVQGHPAPPAGLHHPPGERGARELGAGPAGAVRQPHHPALRAGLPWVQEK